MKSGHNWRRSLLGRVIFYIGSIRFAIPLLTITSISLVYGTWIESTVSARQAGNIVYGSWWFISLMALICITLVLAVVTRYPWRKKHTGFIIVHTALITIIVSAFVTFFTGVEGEMALKEGMSASALRLEHNQLQLLAHEAGEFTLIGSAIVDRPSTVSINDVRFEIVELWANSTEELTVKDDGLKALHAIELDIGHGDGGHWVGQLRFGEQAPMLHGAEVRVLPEGETWTPPTPDEIIHAVLRHSKNDNTVDIDAMTPAIGDGWEIESIERFKHAIVGEFGLEDGESNRDNPAVQVVLKHVDGSRERHAAFDHFRTSVNKKQIEGQTFSEYVLEYQGESIEHPLLLITRADGLSTATVYVRGAGPQSMQLIGNGPWEIDVAGEPGTIMHAYGNARGVQELVEAPQGAENKPVARVRVVEDDADHDHDTMSLGWGQRSMIQIHDQVMGIAYAPATTPVPFSIQLIEFRKRDYPGSEMAMAYESDVVFTDEAGKTHEQTIWMNNPLEYKGWKVYQAGFVGSDLSIFQVARDPGLIPMYIGCVLLCTGILVMYYSKAYTHGHPGMPKVFDNKSKRRTIHASAPNTTAADTSPDERTSSGKRDDEGQRLEVPVCADRSPGPRAHHADGQPRSTRRSRSHRSNKVG